MTRLGFLCVLAAGCGAWLMLAGSTAALVRASEPAAAEPTAPVGTAPAAGEASSLLQELNFHALWLDNAWSDWLVLLAAVLVGLALGKTAAAVLGRLADRLQSRGWPLRAEVCRGLSSPLNLALLTLGLTFGLADLKMSPAMHAFRFRTLTLLYCVAAFWCAYNLIGVFAVVLQRLGRRSESALDQQLIPLIRKTLRILLVIIALLFVIDTVFKQDIGAWLAGLGIAGLAVSLAAQDSLKNLFGSITILMDQPFRVGEQIIFGTCEGMVEEIGFRSTKVRTGSGSLVNIPNAAIVNSPVENLARRPYIRRSMTLWLRHDTPRAKVQQALEILRRLLAEPGFCEPIQPEVQGKRLLPRIHFSDVAAEGLSLSILYWYAPPNWWDYTEHAERLNLQILTEFEQAGIVLAAPLPAGRPV